MYDSYHDPDVPASSSPSSSSSTKHRSSRLNSASTITPNITPNEQAVARDASSSSAPSSLMMEQVLSWSPENLSVIPRLSFQAADPSERAAATALTQMSSFPPPLGVVEAKSSSESDETESFTTSPPPPPHHHSVQQHHHHQKTTTAGTSYRPKTVLRRSSKTHVPSACVNCKRAHLACDVGRPCRRCISLGKQSTCEDVQHKKRGRPKLKDRSPVAVSSSCLIPKKGKSVETQSANEETYSTTQPRRMMSVSMPHLLHSGGDPSSSSTSSKLGGDVAGNNVMYQPYETRPFFSPPLLPTYFPQGLLTISPSQPPPPLPPPPPQPRMIYQLPKFDITNDMMATLTTSASNHPTPLEPSNSFRVFSPAVRSSVFPPTANATPSPTALALGAGAGVSTGRVSAQEKVLSLVLTADNLLICQASSECREFWNLEPSFLMGRSLYSLVPMKDHEKLHRLQGNALKAAGFTDPELSFVANYCEADPFAFQFLDLPRLIEHAHGWPNDEGFFGSTEAFSDSIGINASPQLIRQFRVNISFGGGGYGADISRRSTLARGGCLVLEVRTFGWVDAARDEDVPMRERLY